MSIVEPPPPMVALSGLAYVEIKLLDLKLWLGILIWPKSSDRNTLPHPRNACIYSMYWEKVMWNYLRQKLISVSTVKWNSPDNTQTSTGQQYVLHVNYW